MSLSWLICGWEWDELIPIVAMMAQGIEEMGLD
jgi:hypothetical protein